MYCIKFLNYSVNQEWDIIYSRSILLFGFGLKIYYNKALLVMIILKFDILYINLHFNNLENEFGYVKSA